MPDVEFAPVVVVPPWDSVVDEFPVALPPVLPPLPEEPPVVVLVLPAFPPLPVDPVEPESPEPVTTVQLPNGVTHTTCELLPPVEPEFPELPEFPPVALFVLVALPPSPLFAEPVLDVAEFSLDEEALPLPDDELEAFDDEDPPLPEVVDEAAGGELCGPSFAVA